MLSKEYLEKYCDIEAAIEIFGKLLGWSQERVIDWAQQFKDQLQNPWFDYDGFFWHVGAELVPPSTKKKLNAEKLHELRSCLSGPLLPYWTGEKLDDQQWKMVRYQIDTLISHFDKSYLQGKPTISLKDIEP